MNLWTFLDRNIGEIFLGLFLLTVFGFVPMLACGVPHASANGCGVHIEVGSKTSSDAGAP